MALGIVGIQAFQRDSADAFHSNQDWWMVVFPLHQIGI